MTADENGSNCAFGARVYHQVLRTENDSGSAGSSSPRRLYVLGNLGMVQQWGIRYGNLFRVTGQIDVTGRSRRGSRCRHDRALLYLDGSVDGIRSGDDSLPTSDVLGRPWPRVPLGVGRAAACRIRQLGTIAAASVGFCRECAGKRLHHGSGPVPTVEATGDAPGLGRELVCDNQREYGVIPLGELGMVVGDWRG
jgi:hypothetical protein